MLFGAGISINAGFPTTSDMTSRLLSGHNISRHTDGTYYLDIDFPDAKTFEEPAERNLLLLRRLRMEIDRFYLYDVSFEINYEDLYYLCSQIHDSLLGEYENPLVGPFLREIGQDIARIRALARDRYSIPWEDHELFFEAINYIRDVTWRLLQKKPKEMRYLSFIRDACIDTDISRVDIFTLNHDTLLEDFLDSSDIEFVDGFGQPVGEVRYWNDRLLVDSDAKVRLFKLHGSISWFLFPPNKVASGTEVVGIPLTDDIWHVKDPSGSLQSALGGRPVFLAGTFNKMLDYTSNIYADLYCHFRQSLRQSNVLVVSGYGFGDKGINSQIVEWMYQSNLNNVYLIHPNPDQCRRKSRGVILKHWDNWHSANRLKILESGIEDADWASYKVNISVE